MELKLILRSERARCCVLHLPGDVAALHTPCMILPTRKGLPEFITEDLLTQTHPDTTLLQINPLHFLDGPSPSTIQEIGGAHQLLGVHRRALVALTRDSLAGETDGQHSTKLAAAFETSSGRRSVGPAKLMEILNALKPNAWTSLADEVPACVTSKRNKISVDRTLHWLDQCLSLQTKNCFGTVVGGTSIEQRKRSAVETAKRNVSGFSLGGFGLGESPEERTLLLETVIDCLPADRPRIVSGLGMPEEVIQAVSAGVDLFDSTYPHLLTKGGYGMVFSLTMEHKQREYSVEDAANVGVDSSKINLRSAAYKCDVSPIMDGCKCYTCNRHSKAYINHLLNTHEMVAQTLLDIHNTHHYLCFFQAIRDAICGNYFEEFKTPFQSNLAKSRVPNLGAAAPLSSSLFIA